MSHWRDKAKRIVCAVLAETAGKPEAEIKKALHGAYPFGPREYHPYKIWLSEIKRQRGATKKHAPCACTHSKGAHHSRGGACAAADCRCAAYGPDERQETLF